MNVKIERWQYFPYLWIQESVLSDLELKTNNDCGSLILSALHFQPQEGKIQ